MTEADRIAAETAAHLAENARPQKAVAIVLVWDDRGQVRMTHCRADQSLIEYVAADALEPATPTNTMEIVQANVRETIMEHAYGRFSRGVKA